MAIFKSKKPQSETLRGKEGGVQSLECKRRSKSQSSESTGIMRGRGQKVGP
jgi:hypothetical protein